LRSENVANACDPLALGCKVIATASKESKRQICIQKGGADYAIDYSAKDWQKEVMKITGGKGVDVVYDPVVSLRVV
jgi:NADPH2:quinone reductase